MNVKSLFNAGGMRKVNYEMSERSSRRIDIVRFYLIMTVVIMHSTITFDTMPAWMSNMVGVANSFTQVCNMGFYFLSGIMLLRKPVSYFENLKKKIRSLVIPYLFINLFWLLFWIVIRIIPFTSGVVGNGGTSFVQGWGWYDYIDNIFIHPICYPTYFLRNLFLMNLVAPLIRILVDYLSWAVPVILLFITYFGIFCPLSIVGWWPIIFFSLGGCVVRSNLHLEQVDRVPSWIWLLLFMGVWLLELNYPEGWGMWSYVQMLRCALEFMMFITLGTRYLSGKPEKILTWISRYAFCIFLFHECSLSLFRAVCMKVLPMNNAGMLFCYFGGIIIISAWSVFVGWLLQRYEPWLYSVLTGARRVRA